MSFDKKNIMVKLKFEGKDLADCDFWTKSDPYLTIKRPPRAGSGFINVRRTETIRNNLNPKWSLIYISLSELCDGDYSLPLHLEVFDEDRNSRDDFIGSAQVTLQQLMNYSQNGTVITLKKGSKNRGDLLVREASQEEDHTELIRKMSATSYPARKPSSAPQHLQNPGANLFPVPESEPRSQSQGPSPFYPEAPQYPHHQPLAASASMPTYPQLPAYPQLPEDPTDTRPASIWI